MLSYTFGSIAIALGALLLLWPAFRRWLNYQIQGRPARWWAKLGDPKPLQRYEDFGEIGPIMVGVLSVLIGISLLVVPF